MPQKFHLLNFVDNFSWVGSTNSFFSWCCVCVCVCVHYKLFLWHDQFWFGLVTGAITVPLHQPGLVTTGTISDHNQVWSQVPLVPIRFGHWWYHWYHGLVTGTIKVVSRKVCLPGTPVDSGPSEKI